MNSAPCGRVQGATPNTPKSVKSIDRLKESVEVGEGDNDLPEKHAQGDWYCGDAKVSIWGQSLVPSVVVPLECITDNVHGYIET